ncbi:DUF4126 family protein [Mucilaginibacter ginkgonis]|uniref:DUF4126 family protein n=1 Tax=Mucilaginibacter ginkgonis TaxID=2682091 RepID=A0A6I4HWQ9_9SPHI|nr:DUF4126 family protein [Mucilaginibacter ginkgonis]QQL51380.1 DUF4126 family protein [Mucilaginibacter ginkgonis]
MSKKMKEPFWQAVGVGALAGMRTFSAPAVTSHILSHHHSRNIGRSGLKFMQNDKVSVALKVLALSEFVGDKMPSAPNRIQPAGLIGRVAAGMVAGASIYKAAGNKPLRGVIIGGVSALASTYASFYIRKQTVKQTRILDPVIGLIEDALVVSGGAGLAAA